MKKTFPSFLFLLLLFSSTIRVAAQSVFGYSFNAVSPQVCPWDSSKTINWPTGWTIYQTLNDNWGGPVDSTRCIGAIVQGNRVVIPLNQIDPNKALFIRASAMTVQNSGIATFSPNALFSTNVLSELDKPEAQLQISSNCPEDICTGMFIGIGIPDQFGTPNADLRIQTNIADGAGQFQYWEACLPSEKFEVQTLREVILKYTFTETAVLQDAHLKLFNVSIYQDGAQAEIIEEIPASPAFFNGVEYDVPISELANYFPFYWTLFMLQHPGTTYPSAQNLGFIEAFPEQNTSTPQTINLVVNEFQTLLVQPFTQIRGGLTEGSQTLRHQANLVDMGGELCFNYIDLIFSGGDEFRYSHGALGFQNPYACMQFRRGSALRVLENGKLHYGQNGAGMLLLCATSTIALERNAAMTIDGLLMLNECEPDLGPQHIYIDLPVGTSLRFTDKARISNQFSQNQAMRLRVRMQGGLLDDTALDPASRALIERVYPEPAPNMDENVQVFPNPLQTEGTLRYLSAGSETVQVKWLHLNGQLLTTRPYNAVKGLNEWEVQAPKLPGAYLLHITSQQGSTIKKIIVVE